MRFLFDTNVLLNDFFHRQPDYGFQRIQNPEQAAQVEAHRQSIHENLIWLSLQAEAEVWTTVGIISRFGALLGDLIVPNDLVLDEMSHLISNFKLIETTNQHLEKALLAMETSNPQVDFDDCLMKMLATENEIDVVVSSVPKSKTYYWPILVFPPEKLRELNLKDLPVRES